MATIHISEADAVRDFAAVMEQLRDGAEIIIDDGKQTFVIQTKPTKTATLRDVVALMEKHRDALDEDFARDVQAGIDAHRDPYDPPAWD